MEDCLTKATSVQGEIPTGIPPFYLDRGGIGVNKIRQQGAVDVDGAVHTTAGFFKEGEECLYPSTLEPLVRELTSNKLEKVSPSVSGNFPALGTDGTLVDSGIPARLPTAAEVGAAIEVGSNANGEYRLFPDGTLICTKTITFSAAINIPYGAIYFG